ncbi:peptidase C14, caspase catalytic subunit p20 [Richelia sinica FACHB-800]|uniref:Peptidase C14, caspase catalytic subunit p20 n=1 Tax=Richelia sinica FACHB-800 TaxID=1357546 RepID=A0A975T9J6_9NOST|nr:caspase family protein [Richelia sinica]MBD2665942.1 caspase family protein [Richelia sinica FACHB-800]QXE23948.1 peptidase C14, caspase catalytic subunit p20 [Richelia sinica FACHB-800]
MVNYWAIAIGINQYQLFQPLTCAQADAEAIKDFLVVEAGFLPENCLLMTNTSPPLSDKSTYPTKEHILSWLEELTAKSWQPEDHIWLFFSGYGVNYNDKDYLMPIEGNPDLVAETGIEVRSLMQGLQVAGLKPLLIFDINRAFGTQADAPVGQEIMELAQELQIATILSCQPEEFSHESSELGYGLFTAALLEALRSETIKNLADLDHYLISRTPQLCQHHWRPIQIPLIFIPFLEPVILPSLQAENQPDTEAVIFPEESFAIAVAAPPLGETKSTTPDSSKPTWSANSALETTLTPAPPTKEKITNLATVPKSSGDSNSLSHHHSGRFIPSTSKNHQGEIPIWKQFILWGGGSMIVVGIIATFVLRNQATFRLKHISKTIPNNTQQMPQALPSNPPGVPATNQSLPSPEITADSNKRNQAMLELEKMSLQANQASDLSTAIASAQKIKPGEPMYAQAQENIQIWSQMILDLATSRVKQRKYASAIAAAQLITKDNSLYNQAQTAIEQWRQEARVYLSNKTLLEAASGLIRPGQASSYNRAIEVAKKVPPGQPGFELAQKTINQWSEKILDLAKNRAAEGDFQAAIDTATLVPEVTGAYEDAQDAIQKWQQKKRN